MPNPCPVIDYFDDEEEVSIVELAANGNESDVTDNPDMMDYEEMPENQNKNNEYSPSVSGFSHEIYFFCRI